MPRPIQVSDVMPRADVVTAEIAFGYFIMRLDVAEVGSRIPSNAPAGGRHAGLGDAPQQRMCVSPYVRTLLGTETSVLLGAPDDVSVVLNTTFLDVEVQHRQVFSRPLSQLVASPEHAMEGRITHLEGVLRGYFESVGQDVDLPVYNAAQEALRRLGAPLLLDRRRLQIPLHLAPGEEFVAQLRCERPLTLTATVELRVCFEWLEKRPAR